MIDELELLRRVRPEVPPPNQEVRTRARARLDQAIGQPQAGRRAPSRTRPRLGALVPALGALVVAAVAALFLSINAGKPSTAGPASGAQLVFVARTTRGRPASSAAVRKTAAVLQQRLDVVAPGTRITSAGDQLFVRLPAAAPVSARDVIALARGPVPLLFYDWEANVLAPSGKLVAVLLRSQDPTAISISRGAGEGPGGSATGAMPLYRAVRLAARQPAKPSASNARPGPEYLMFAAPRSAACTHAATYYHVKPARHQPCYLAGPEARLRDLRLALPPGVRLSASGVQTLEVPRGWTVLRAASPSFVHGGSWSDPAARYYVLRDDVAVSAASITHPRQSIDQSGAPDIEFGFTGPGGRAFQRVTANLARRGNLVSRLGDSLNQHFAVVVDSQILSVPFIDYKAFPDGIPANNGADIVAGFTTRSAQQLAAALRPAHVPVTLELVAINGRGVQ